MPISIISSDNIFDLDNSENILKTTLVNEDVIEIDQSK
ncbi:unnamed protein product [Acanthoscelides obtectus]|uniref:Uncharacterized protein n=1 Tax=Acanthoscelides obtectus TaxID=200917 RepID=A0A9P0P7T6_ACAOB|nr:unnamed protein product [Acanthoscelides obtectus]CAK1683105.1 hypothetical protein AOBTE_LOCUS34082 [Acanthoscelides obtectus]